MSRITTWSRHGLRGVSPVRRTPAPDSLTLSDTHRVELPDDQAVAELEARRDLPGLLELDRRLREAVPVGATMTPDHALAVVAALSRVASAIDRLTATVAATDDPRARSFDPERGAGPVSPRVPPQTADDDPHVAQRAREAHAALHGGQEDDAVKRRADEVWRAMRGERS